VLCNKHKLVIAPNSGAISAEPDVNSNVFEASCVGSIDDATHVSMSSSFMDCDGAIRYRQTFVDKDTFLAELIASNIGDIALDDLTTTGLINAHSLKINNGTATLTGMLTATASLLFGGGSIPANVRLAQNITVVGAQGNDTIVLAWQFLLPDGLIVQNPYVALPDIVAVTIKNTTAAPIALPAQNVRATVFKFTP
jgi:hypothetical protein